MPTHSCITPFDRRRESALPPVARLTTAPPPGKAPGAEQERSGRRPAPSTRVFGHFTTLQIVTILAARTRHSVTEKCCRVPVRPSVDVYIQGVGGWLAQVQLGDPAGRERRQL